MKLDSTITEATALEFLQEVFVRYWREVVVAMLLTATLPFFRRHVRRLRARVIAFFTVRKRLETALLEAEKWRKKSEEAEQKYLAEVEDRRKAVEEAERLRKELEEKRAALAEAERKAKGSKLARTFNIFSRTKEDNTQNEELERLNTALERAERLRQNEAELKRKALDEIKRLNGLLAKAQQELQAIEAAKPAPGSLTAKLLELLKACKTLPYPQNTDFWRVPNEVRDFLSPNGEALRMKIMGAAQSYFSSYYSSSAEQNARKAKCTVFYVLMVIAQGVSDGLISVDDSKRLTWKRAGELLDKVNTEYFNEHPEVDTPDDDEESDGKNFIAGAFGSYPPEVILEDKAFIQALLPSTKSV